MSARCSLRQLVTGRGTRFGLGWLRKEYDRHSRSRVDYHSPYKSNILKSQIRAE